MKPAKISLAPPSRTGDEEALLRSLRAVMGRTTATPTRRRRARVRRPPYRIVEVPVPRGKPEVIGTSADNERGPNTALATGGHITSHVEGGRPAVRPVTKKVTAYLAEKKRPRTMSTADKLTTPYREGRTPNTRLGVKTATRTVAERRRPIARTRLQKHTPSRNSNRSLLSAGTHRTLLTNATTEWDAPPGPSLALPSAQDNSSHAKPGESRLTDVQSQGPAPRKGRPFRPVHPQAATIPKPLPGTVEAQVRWKFPSLRRRGDNLDATERTSEDSSEYFDTSSRRIPTTVVINLRPQSVREAFSANDSKLRPSLFAAGLDNAPGTVGDLHSSAGPSNVQNFVPEETNYGYSGECSPLAEHQGPGPARSSKGTVAVSSPTYQGEKSSPASAYCNDEDLGRGSKRMTDSDSTFEWPLTEMRTAKKESISKLSGRPPKEYEWRGNRRSSVVHDMECHKRSGQFPVPDGHHCRSPQTDRLFTGSKRSSSLKPTCDIVGSCEDGIINSSINKVDVAKNNKAGSMCQEARVPHCSPNAEKERISIQTGASTSPQRERLLFAPISQSDQRGRHTEDDTGTREYFTGRSITSANTAPHAEDERYSVPPSKTDGEQEKFLGNIGTKGLDAPTSTSGPYSFKLRKSAEELENYFEASPTSGAAYYGRNGHGRQTLRSRSLHSDIEDIVNEDKSALKKAHAGTFPPEPDSFKGSVCNFSRTKGVSQATKPLAFGKYDSSTLNISSATGGPTVHHGQEYHAFTRLPLNHERGMLPFNAESETVTGQRKPDISCLSDDSSKQLPYLTVPEGPDAIWEPFMDLYSEEVQQTTGSFPTFTHKNVPKAPEPPFRPATGMTDVRPVLTVREISHVGHHSKSIGGADNVPGRRGLRESRCRSQDQSGVFRILDGARYPKDTTRNMLPQYNPPDGFEKGINENNLQRDLPTTTRAKEQCLHNEVKDSDVGIHLKWSTQQGEPSGAWEPDDYNERMVSAPDDTTHGYFTAETEFDERARINSDAELHVVTREIFNNLHRGSFRGHQGEITHDDPEEASTVRASLPLQSVPRVSRIHEPVPTNASKAATPCPLEDFMCSPHRNQCPSDSGQNGIKDMTSAPRGNVRRSLAQMTNVRHPSPGKDWKARNTNRWSTFESPVHPHRYGGNRNVPGDEQLKTVLSSSTTRSNSEPNIRLHGTYFRRQLAERSQSEGTVNTSKRGFFRGTRIEDSEANWSRPPRTGPLNQRTKLFAKGHPLNLLFLTSARDLLSTFVSNKQPAVTVSKDATQSPKCTSPTGSLKNRKKVACLRNQPPGRKAAAEGNLSLGPEAGTSRRQHRSQNPIRALDENVAHPRKRQTGGLIPHTEPQLPNAEVATHSMSWAVQVTLYALLLAITLFGIVLIMKTFNRFASPAEVLGSRRSGRKGNYSGLSEGAQSPRTQDFQINIKRHYICNTTSCAREGGYVTSAMSWQRDPCVDFYEFVCNRWREWHDTGNMLEGASFSARDELEQGYERSMIKLLTGPYQREQHLELVPLRQLLDACSDVNAHNAAGWMPFAEALRMCHLENWPYVPPVLSNVSVWSSAARTFLCAHVESFLSIEVTTHPKRWKMGVITLDLPSILLRLEDLQGNESSHWLQDAVESAVTSFRDPPFPSLLASDVTGFAHRLARTVYSRDSMSDTKLYRLVNLSRYAQVIEYISPLFRNISPVHGSTQVLVKPGGFLEDLIYLVDSTPAHIVLNYLGFRLLVHVSLFLPQVPADLFWLRARSLLPVLLLRRRFVPRYRVCVRQLAETLPYLFIAAARLIIGEHARIRNIINAVEAVRKELLLQLSTSAIFDTTTRDKALSIISGTILRILDPGIVLEANKTADYAARIPAINSTQPLISYVQSTLHMTHLQLTYSHDLQWRGSILPAECSTDLQENAVFFSTIFLNATTPQVDDLLTLHLPGLGIDVFRCLFRMLIEDAATLDNPELVSRGWWTEEAKSRLRTTRRCLRAQYSDADAITPYEREMTSLRDVSDNAAVTPVLELFLKNLQTLSGPRQEFRLKTAEDIRPEHLFFFYYALAHCEKDARGRPGPVVEGWQRRASQRVNVPLKNCPTFHSAYECKPGSPMNPTRKCFLWK